MIDRILDGLKEIFWGDKTVLRKLRLLRYLACVVVIFIFFCKSYWNVLAYIDLPCAPLLDEKYRTILHSTGIIVFIFWIIYSISSSKVYVLVGEKYQMKLSYIFVLCDWLFSVYFLLYALNLAIEYANGLVVHMKIEIILAVCYLLYCALEVSYTIHQNNYKPEKMEYTHYCDSKGHPIPVDARIFYRGKEYKVIEHEGIYRILPHGEKIRHAGLFRLEEAASDIEGKIFLKK